MSKFGHLIKLTSHEVISYFFTFLKEDKNTTHLRYDGKDNLFFYRIKNIISDEYIKPDDNIIDLWNEFVKVSNNNFGMEEYNNGTFMECKLKIDKYLEKQYEEYLSSYIESKESKGSKDIISDKEKKISTYENKDSIVGSPVLIIDELSTIQKFSTEDVVSDGVEFCFWNIVGQILTNNGVPWREDEEGNIITKLRTVLVYNYINDQFIISTFHKKFVNLNYNALQSIEYKVFDNKNAIKFKSLGILVNKNLMEFIPANERENYKKRSHVSPIKLPVIHELYATKSISEIMENNKVSNSNIVTCLREKSKDPDNLGQNVNIIYNINFSLFTEQEHNTHKIKYYLTDRGISEKVRKFEHVIDSMWNLCEYKNQRSGYYYCFNIKTLYDFLFVESHSGVKNMKDLVEKNKQLIEENRNIIKEIFMTEIQLPITFTTEVKKFIKNNDSKYMILELSNPLSKGTSNQPLLYIRESFRNG